MKEITKPLIIVVSCIVALVAAVALGQYLVGEKSQCFRNGGFPEERPYVVTNSDKTTTTYILVACTSKK
jgi:hypothetical protein